MQKLGLGVGALVVAGVAALPMVSGYLGEQSFRQGLEQVQEPGLELALVDYQRGYLDGSATTRISLTDPEMLAQMEQEGMPTEFELRHEFKHGLFSVSGQTRPLYSEAQREMVNELWGEGADPIRLSTETNWQGQTDFDLTVDGFEFTEEGATLNWSEMVAKGSSSVDGAVDFELNWPGMQIDDQGERISVEEIKASGEGKMQHGIWLGVQRFSLARFGIESPEVNAEFKAFSGEMTNEREGDLYGGVSKLQLASMHIGDSKLDNLQLQLQAQGFDAEAIEQLSANQNMSDAAELQAFTAALDKLVARGFELQVQPLSADLEAGALLGELQLKVEPGLEQASQMPFAVMQQLDGSVSLSLPMALLENPLWAEELGGLVEMGLLVPEEDRLVLNASIKPGEAPLLNGQPMNM